MTECNMLNFLFEIGIVLLLFSLFKRNKGTFFFMKFSILIIAIPVLFVCSFFYLGTEETLQEAMPGIAIWRCAFILLASLLLLGLSTLISHLSFRNLFNKEQKRKILMIESIVYLVLSIGFMATWIYDVFWSISRLGNFSKIIKLRTSANASWIICHRKSWANRIIISIFAWNDRMQYAKLFIWNRYRSASFFSF